ncbi:MAG: murein hydrolase activator EnvC family protein [Bdellovibrionia bacterium]
MISRKVLIFSSLLWVSSVGANPSAEVPGPGSAQVKKSTLVSRLGDLRVQIHALEQDLSHQRTSQQKAWTELKKVKKLIALQKLERDLGMKRMKELEATVSEMELRKTQLSQKIQVQSRTIRASLTAMGLTTQGSEESPPTLASSELESLQALRRKVLARLADRGLKELEALRVDYQDAEKLESQIHEEKQHLAYLFEDLKEQQSILELNQSMQISDLKQRQREKAVQLEHYRKLKSAESRVEGLIEQFNARRELEKNEEAERVASKAMRQGLFSQMKGKLRLPVQGGRVISGFGRTFDPQSGLYVFKKGLDIVVHPKTPVRAIAPGKVAYAGELPHYGQVVIVDHGDHYYSLCSHLSQVSKKVSEPVEVGDLLGLTGDLKDPLYFEIRARNVALNPLQWVLN